MNALYGTMVASLLYYKKFVKSLTEMEFTLNPYDPCVANKMVNGKQLTTCFHVDDCKISHVDSKVVDETIETLRQEYEVIFEDGSGAMKVHRGKVHEYLGMKLDFSRRGTVEIFMYKYLDNIQKTFDEAVKSLKESDGFTLVARCKNKATATAAPTDLFEVNEECEKLDKKAAKACHTIVAMILFVSERVRPDASMAMSFLTKRVKSPDRDDWRKLCHLVEYLKLNRDRPLILGANDSGDLVWYVDASFAVHPNYRSHTGGGLTFGIGFLISISTGQRLHTRSSTEAELVAIDDMMPVIL